MVLSPDEQDITTDTLCPSHPFISFRFDLRKTKAKFWRLIGEAKATIQAIAMVPLSPATRESMHAVWLARGAVATTAIEGFTLEEADALRVVQGASSSAPGLGYDERAVRNIVDACNAIVDGRLVPEGRFSVDELCRFNAMVLAGLPLQGGVIPGVLRTYGVVVGDGIYRAPSADYVPTLCQKYIDWLNSFPYELESGQHIEAAIIKAIIGHLYLAWIHPFGDGNGRTARLVELSILWDGGVSTPVAHLLSNHYNRTRGQYYQRLAGAVEQDGVVNFLQYALEGLGSGLQEQLEWVTVQHRNLVWREMVTETLEDQRGEAKERRYLIATSLGEDPKPKSAIRELIPKLVSLYARKTPKTLTRDLNELTRLRLIRETSKGYVAQWEHVSAYLPRTAKRREAVPKQDLVKRQAHASQG